MSTEFINYSDGVGLRHSLKLVMICPGLMSTMSATTLTKGSILPMDLKLELVMIPVSDVDRAKAFYVDNVGFNADHDHTVNPELRFVQLTPPGSACSIAIGMVIVDTTPGSVHGMQLVVEDIEATRADLVGRGADVSEIADLAWGRFIYFADPDGNQWAVQEIPAAMRA
jgi:predicted enzyme related to lactoylglutathione lyase